MSTNRQQHQATFRNLIPERSSKSDFESTFNLLEWNQTQIAAFQQLIYATGDHNIYCPMVSASYHNDKSQHNLQGYTNTTPSISCSYETPDTCTGKVPLPCCQRLNGRSTIGSSSGSMLQFSIMLIIAMLVIVIRLC